MLEILKFAGWTINLNRQVFLGPAIKRRDIVWRDHLSLFSTPLIDGAIGFCISETEHFGVLIRFVFYILRPGEILLK